MSRTAFNRHTLGWIAAALIIGAGAGTSAFSAQAAQDSGTRTIISSEVHVSRDHAELTLQANDGRELEITIRDDHLWIDGREVGDAPRGGELDRAWRSLLNEAMDVPSGELATLLVDWDTPDGGKAIVDALAATLVVAPRAAGADPDIGPSADTLAKLERLIAEKDRSLSETRAELDELRERLDDRAPSSATGRREARRTERREWTWTSPFYPIWEGIGGIFQTLATYAVLLALGFAAVFFGRQYLESVADTARAAPVRAGAVGLAASFLILPAFILGMIVLAISIVGIPLLLVWIPFFPVAVALAALFGYLGISHATGEALAERRFDGGELYRRANSYYYVLTGAGLLLALFIAANIVHMAGPWLGFLKGLLQFIAIVVTWASFTIGFGAVLISRAGTRPAAASGASTPDLDVDDVFEEETRV